MHIIFVSTSVVCATRTFSIVVGPREGIYFVPSTDGLDTYLSSGDYKITIYIYASNQKNNIILIWFESCVNLKYAPLSLMHTVRFDRHIYCIYIYIYVPWHPCLAYWEILRKCTTRCVGPINVYNHVVDWDMKRVCRKIMKLVLCIVYIKQNYQQGPST